MVKQDQILQSLPKTDRTLWRHYLTSAVRDPKAGTRGIPGVTIHFTTKTRRYKVALHNQIIGHVEYDRNGKRVT